MTRLPGHCAPRSTPEKATAQTMPSRFTTVAHIWLLRPLLSACVAVSSAAFSAACDGRPRHAPGVAERPRSAVAVDGEACAWAWARAGTATASDRTAQRAAIEHRIMVRLLLGV